MLQTSLKWILFTFLIIPIILFSQQTEYWTQIQKYAEKQYLTSEAEKDIWRFTGDTGISADETVTGHLVVVSGNLIISGTIQGDVLVIDGNVDVLDSAVVHGDVTSIGGSVYLSENGIVHGNMIETHPENITAMISEENYRYESEYRPDYYGALPVPETQEDIAFRYNRVEGLFLGVQIPKEFRRIDRFTGYGFAGYGFKSQAWRYQWGLDRWFFNPLDYRTELGFEFHDLTDTKDNWRISYLENNLAALFFREDFYDYFRRKGFSIHLSQNISRFLRVSAAYRADKYESMANETGWSLFGGNKEFPDNPALGEDEGFMRSIYSGIYLDTRDHKKYPDRGWYFLLNSENSNDRLKSDFNFDRYILDIRRYQPLMRGESLHMRLILGTSRGELPVQKNFELGGIGTLRGFRFKEFTGSRMFLLNTEYKLNSSIFGIRVSDFYGDTHGFKFILFSDIGQAWSGTENESLINSFEGLSLSKLKMGAGIALASINENFRINFAKRTDREGDISISVRLRQPF